MEGVRVAMKWQEKARYAFNKNNQMVSIGAIFTFIYHTKQLNPWLNSSANHVVNYSQLSAFQRNMEPFEGNLSTCRHLISLRNKPHQMQPGEILLSMTCRIVSYCEQLWFDGEKCVLMLYAWKPAFLKSSHIWCSL